MDNTNRIFLHKVFKAIADSIIKIFIPLYILKTTNNINLSIIYIAIYSLFVFILQIALKKIYQKHNILCIIIHCIPIIATQIILSFCQINIYICVTCALLMSISQVFYSVPINTIFALNDKKTNVAKFEISTNTGKIIFTIISGLLLAKLPNSFIFLSGIATIIYIISIIPIAKFNTQNTATINNNPTSYSCNYTFRLYHISFSLFQTTIDTLIPLYLYVNNLSFEAITTVIALVELFKIIANIMAKKLVSLKLLKTSCIISFAIFISSLAALLIFKNATILYIFSSIIAISFPLSFVPLFYIFCRQAKNKTETITNMALRDIDIFSPRTLYYSTFFLGGFITPIVLGFASGITMLICQIKTINANNKFDI